MIHTTSTSFLQASAGLSTPAPGARSSMAAAMLVSPSAIAISTQAASDNVYMDVNQSIDPQRALQEHQGLIQTLNGLGVPTLVFPGVPGQPDGCYLNNAFGVGHRRLILGAMRHPDRQAETKRQDIRGFFSSTLGFDIVSLDKAGVIAELTGVLIIDRLRGLGFLGRSGRVNEVGEALMAEAFGLNHTLAFDLVPEEYHTNIVLSILACRAAVVHEDSILGTDCPDALTALYEGQVLQLNDAEKNAFAGNCLAVTEGDVLMSETALNALRPSSINTLEGFGFRVHGIPLKETEKAGGSLRCLIAEVY